MTTHIDYPRLIDRAYDRWQSTLASGDARLIHQTHRLYWSLIARSEGIRIDRTRPLGWQHV